MTNVEIWTVKDIKRWMVKKFIDLKFETPALDADLLLAEALKTTRMQIILSDDRPLTLDERAILREYTKRRINCEPIAYIINKKHWHEYEFFVDKRVLIPRPETEDLLDYTLSIVKYFDFAINNVFDLCTGSGCLAISLAKKYENAKVLAVDISEQSLAVADININKNAVLNVKTLCSDLVKEEFYIKYQSNNETNIIVANPPYVSETDWLNCQNSVKNFEPKIALIASEDGLSISKKIWEYFLRYLCTDKCVFIMEVGENHPQIIVSNLNVFSPYNTTSELPLAKPFALKDRAGKIRFLCYINNQ